MQVTRDLMHACLQTIDDITNDLIDEVHECNWTVGDIINSLETDMYQIICDYMPQYCKSFNMNYNDN